MKKFPAVQPRYRDPHAYPDGIAYMDGQYLPMSEAKVSVLDYGFLHSDATYDTVHVWRGRFFRLDLHLERFFANVDRLHLRLPFDRDGVREVLMNCVGLSGHRDAYVEMICTRGTSPTFCRDPRQAENRFMAFAIPFGWVADEEQRRRGLHVAVSSVVRIPPQSVDPATKNYHWLDLIAGLYDAYERGAETAVLVDTAGNITEGPGFNIFIAKNGRLTTPASGVLPGITRRTVFDLCAEAGIEVAMADVSRAALGAADEVFVSSTAGGVMAVTRVDDRPVGDGSIGRLARQIIDLYWRKHDDPVWTTPVDYPAD